MLFIQQVLTYKPQPIRNHFAASLELKTYPKGKNRKCFLGKKGLFFFFFETHI